MVSEFRDSAVSWKASFLAIRVKFSVDFKYVERSGIAESFWHAWQIELKDGSSPVKFFLARLPESDAFQLRSDTRGSRSRNIPWLSTYTSESRNDIIVALLTFLRLIFFL